MRRSDSFEHYRGYRLTDDTVSREPSDLLHVIGHQIEGIGHDHDDGIRRMLLDARPNLLDDLSVLADEVLTSSQVGAGTPT